MELDREAVKQVLAEYTGVSSKERIMAHLCSRFPDASDDEIKDAVRRIVAGVAGSEVRPMESP